VGFPPFDWAGFSFFGFFGFGSEVGAGGVDCVVLVLSTVVCFFEPLPGLLFPVPADALAPFSGFGFFSGLPDDFPLDVCGDVAVVVFFAFFGFLAPATAAAWAVTHAPSVSPWRRCAGHAFTEIEIVFLPL
jgi:hypothetical protein